MTFNKPDPVQFRAALVKAGFYTQWQKSYGAEAWARAFVLVEEIGYHRLRRRGAGGLADADADPGERQGCHALRHAAQERHRAPERKCARHDVAPAEPVGMDKGQISRALAGLVSRKLVSRAAKPRDDREVLVWLTRSRLIAHETIVAGALERNQRLLEQLGKDEVAGLLEQIDRLTETAAKMLDAEKDLS
jgi:hypothetical protein